jgi:hypothetical protein
VNAPPLEPELLARLEAAVMARQGRKEGTEIRFLCPGHDDHDPSARYHPEKAAWTCDSCGTGGGALDLARRLGLEVPQAEAGGLTLEDLAQRKGIDPAFLRSLGVADGWAGRDRRPCVDVPYCDTQGNVRAIRKRLHLDREPRFIWRRGDHPLAYGLTRLGEARAAGRLLLVEGESDAWTCWQAGLPALGVPGASAWQPPWIRHLQGIGEIFVWREPDKGGDTLAAKIALDFPNVRIIDAPAEAKDPSAVYLQDRAAFAGRMRELMGRARPASELRAEALGQEARECLALARSLLDAPKLLDVVADAIRAGGYAGDLTAPLLVYVALTSRLLERPLNLALIAPSAAGKNRAVDANLPLVPPSAYHMEKAGSARALVYGEADYQHRMVIAAEADSIPEDGPAASAARALAADNCMTYDVVERDAETGRFTVRHIEKPGPTGLITTSTKPLGEQMGTRLLTVSVPDTPTQTRAVLQAHAASVNGSCPTPDVGALVAAQRWLELGGDHKVTIPFASALAEAVPADLVRMRRDFRQLLTVIQAVALLYQRQRERDAEGRIVATLEDYRQARELLLDVFTEAATGGVSQSVRETVQTVTRLYDGAKPVTAPALADALGLHRATAWRRARTGLRLGFLVNTETRKGQPAKLVPGAPLPEERPALPLPEDVCVYAFHPESDATAQPEASPRIWPESGETVAHSVAGTPPVAQPQPGVQPPMQPAEDPSPDSETAPKGPAVARLHADPGEEDTHTAPGLPALTARGSGRPLD